MKSFVKINESTDWESETIDEGLAEELKEYFTEEMDKICVGIAALEDSRIEEKMGILKVLINYVRIKSMGATYVKAMVDEGINDMDYYRRRKAAANKDGKASGETEQLKVSHDTKAAALEDRTKAIGAKIDNLAGDSEFLRAAATKMKIVGRIKKNEILIKISSKEEAKELGLRNADLSKDLVTKDNELRDYEKENKEEVDEAKDKLTKDKKKEIGDIDDKISALQKKITDIDTQISGMSEALEILEAEGDKEADAEKKKEIAKLHGELAKHKEQKLKLLTQKQKVASEYNALVGKDEYSVDAMDKEIANLSVDLKKDLAASLEVPEPETKTEPVKEPETKTEPVKEPEQKQNRKEQLQKKIELAQKQLDKATSDEDKQKFQTMLNNAKAELEKIVDSADYEEGFAMIEESIDAIIKELNSLGAPSSKIMKFADFMASR